MILGKSGKKMLTKHECREGRAGMFSAKWTIYVNYIQIEILSAVSMWIFVSNSMTLKLKMN